MAHVCAHAQDVRERLGVHYELCFLRKHWGEGEGGISCPCFVDVLFKPSTDWNSSRNPLPNLEQNLLKRLYGRMGIITSTLAYECLPSGASSCSDPTQVQTDCSSILFVIFCPSYMFLSGFTLNCCHGSTKPSPLNSNVELSQTAKKSVISTGLTNCFT